MSQDIIVYGLRDPRTNQIRYIGRSSSWTTRPDQHRRDARRPSDQSPKSVWIRELIDAGLDYEMIVMEQCDTREASMDAERKWIAEGWRLGWPLFNRTHAPSGATYVSAETREKIAATKQRPTVGRGVKSSRPRCAPSTLHGAAFLVHGKASRSPRITRPRSRLASALATVASAT